MSRRVAAFALAGLVAGWLVTLPGSASAGVHGVVRAKEQHRSFFVVKRRLCVGASAELCSWVKLRNGNIGRREYARCAVGDTWPACRKP